MAALTDLTKITYNEPPWIQQAPQRRLKVVDVNIVLASQGGLTNNVAASLFGLSTIEEVTIARDSNSIGYLCGPSYARTLLCFYDLTNATDATRATPADITATVRVTIKGKEA